MKYKLQIGYRDRNKDTWAWRDISLGDGIIHEYDTREEAEAVLESLSGSSLYFDELQVVEIGETNDVKLLA